MNKSIAFFAFTFVGCTLLSSILMGGGGLQSTRLSSAATDSDATLTVDSADNFLEAGILFVNDEKLAYTGTGDTTFTGLTRGYEGTDAAAHADNAIVYSEDAGVLNYAMGFNIATVGATAGVMSIPVIVGKFFTVTVPRLVMWNYSFLEGDMGILGYFFVAVSLGFIITLGLAVISAIMGIFRR